jgi:branched-chain amino acid transport system substrate-binding protein
MKVTRLRDAAGVARPVVGASGTRLRKIGALACIPLAVVGLAACGSSKKSSSTPASTSAGTSSSSSTPASTSAGTSSSSSTPASTSAGTSSSSAPAGAPFVLGFVCACTGPAAATLAGNDRVIQAWASSVNAAGGVNGHPVKVIVKDDGANPATSLQDVKALVEGSHVVGIIDMTVADAAWAPYVTAKGVPVVGGDANLGTFSTVPDFFPSNAPLPPNTVGQVLLAKQNGATHFGTAYCSYAPVCAQVAGYAKSAAAVAGVKASAIKEDPTAPSYAAPCLQFKSDGVDALFVADTSVTVNRFFDACAQQGYHPKAALNLSSLSNINAKDPNMAGGVTASGAANTFDPSLPAVAQMYSALQKYAPGIVGTSKLNFTMIFSWSGGKLFEAAARAGQLTPSSTPADVKQALYKLHNETLGGISPPLNYTPGKPTFVGGYFTQKISGGKFVSLNGNKPTALTPAQAKAAGGP